MIRVINEEEGINYKFSLSKDGKDKFIMKDGTILHSIEELKNYGKKQEETENG